MADKNRNKFITINASDLAEEITSDTFFKAMKSINSFRGDCDVRVWLCQIAKNCYYSYVKKSNSLKLTEAERFEKLLFTKGTSLFSYPIDFEIIFEEFDHNETKLSVKSESGTIDFGKAKGMINDIVKEIY